MKAKMIVLFVLAIVLGAAIAVGISGCSFYHRGETACGLLEDVHINHETKAVATVTRPARD
jgi:hypothetical protein